MRIAYITAGAAGTICGNCLKDNALAAALHDAGHDVLLLPAYTPLRTDETDVSDSRIVFGGINLYLQGKYSFFRNHGILDGLLDSPRLLRWTSSFAIDTDPAQLGAMTRDMFQGERGPYRREMAKLLAVLRDFEPEVAHLTNSMLASMAEPIRQQLGVPVVCSLQGEGDFLAKLPNPYRDECYELLRRHSAHIDAYVAPCGDQADVLADQLGQNAGRIETILPGIALTGFPEPRGSNGSGFAVGFLARVSEEKGLHLLAEAVERLQRQHADRTVELRVAGWRGADAKEYAAKLRERFQFADHGYLSRDEKLAFLAGLDAFSVPATYRASKGLYCLEALAAGVPVAQPRIGAFPELLEATGGGVLCAPNDSADLARKLEALMLDRERARQLGLAGRRAVQADFHAGRMASETLTLYGEVLA